MFAYRVAAYQNLGITTRQNRQAFMIPLAQFRKNVRYNNVNEKIHPDPESGQLTARVNKYKSKIERINMESQAKWET